MNSRLPINYPELPRLVGPLRWPSSLSSKGAPGPPKLAPRVVPVAPPLRCSTRVFCPRCTWMLACLARASRTMANWPAVCSGGPFTCVVMDVGIQSRMRAWAGDWPGQGWKRKGSHFRRGGPSGPYFFQILFFHIISILVFILSHTFAIFLHIS